VTQRGTRFDATRAPGMAARQRFGPRSAGAARGLARRRGHGTISMADRFRNRVRFRGSSPHCARVGQPRTGGVVERLFRTFNEHLVHGRVFRSIDAVREARPRVRRPQRGRVADRKERRPRSPIQIGL
jgi:hypothetical protein